MTLKVYSHSLICTQLKFSNLSTNYVLVKAWSLPPLSTVIGDEFEKPVGRNQPLSFLKKMSASSLDI